MTAISRAVSPSRETGSVQDKKKKRAIIYVDCGNTGIVSNEKPQNI